MTQREGNFKVIQTFQSPSIYLPRENATDVYLSVRLEAGSLHIAKYLIRIAAYFPMQNYKVFPIPQTDRANPAIICCGGIARGSCRCWL